MMHGLTNFKSPLKFQTQDITLISFIPLFPPVMKREVSSSYWKLLTGLAMETFESGTITCTHFHSAKQRPLCQPSGYLASVLRTNILHAFLTSSFSTLPVQSVVTAIILIILGITPSLRGAVGSIDIYRTPEWPTKRFSSMPGQNGSGTQLSLYVLGNEGSSIGVKVTGS